MTTSMIANNPTEALLAKITDGRETLRSMVRGIRLGTRYSLHFALCNRPVDRTLLIAAIRDEFPNDVILEFNLDKPLESLYRYFRDQAIPPNTRAIFVYGMEAWIRSDDNANESPFLLNLNAARDSLSALLKCPMVLWVPEYMVRMLFDAAADFVSVRTGTYDFRYTDIRPLLPAVDNGADPLADSATAEERRQLIADLETLASICDPEPTSAADLVDRANYRLSAARQRQLLGDITGALSEVVAATQDAERVGDVWLQGKCASQKASLLCVQGKLDAALDLLRGVSLGAFEHVGDVRERAVTWRSIADILQIRGELDESLRILTEEVLPVFERLGDARSRAIAMGDVADILKARGDSDEALRIRRQALTVFEQLGENRERAVTMGRIADILMEKGEPKEALRILQEEALPVFERLGAIREKAITLGKIAGALAIQGDQDSAIEIIREEQIPVFESLGAARSVLVCQVNLALILRQRGRGADDIDARQLLDRALDSARKMKLPEAAIIEAMLNNVSPQSSVSLSA